MKNIFLAVVIGAALGSCASEADRREATRQFIEADGLKICAYAPVQYCCSYNRYGSCSAYCTNHVRVPCADQGKASKKKN